MDAEEEDVVGGAVEAGAVEAVAASGAVVEAALMAVVAEMAVGIGGGS